MITSGAAARRLGLRPLARIHTTTVVGSDPLYMLTGVIPATEKVLARAGLTLSDIDLFEVNEAFAPVVLAWARETGRRPGQDQRQRRRDRHRPPAGRQRRPHHDDAGQRARAARRPLRAADDVRGRRHGQRHHHRAALAASGFGDVRSPNTAFPVVERVAFTTRRMRSSARSRRGRWTGYSARATITAVKVIVTGGNSGVGGGDGDRSCRRRAQRGDRLPNPRRRDARPPRT